MVVLQVRTGIDLVFVPRMKGFLANEAAVKKTFHPSELVPNTPEHCAGILAAKEAFFKALQQAPRWLEVEVKKQKNGRPQFVLSELLAQKLQSYDVSITHDGDYAVASVVLLLK